MSKRYCAHHAKGACRRNSYHRGDAKPRADVITRKQPNIPSRIAFQVASKIEQVRVISDENGADRLLGRWRMLISAGHVALIRAQVCS